MRETLQKAHKSSRSLVYVIDDLLNLTKAEEGNIYTHPEIFDLGVTSESSIISQVQDGILANLVSC